VKPWAWFRILFGASAILTWFPRARHLTDNYSSAGIVVASGPLHFARWVVWSPVTAWILWGLLILSSILVMAGRAKKAALLVFLFSSIALLGAEGLNMKAYDRLLCWQAFAMLFCGPGDEDNPVARTMLLLIYLNLYASTGFSKAFIPDWWNGNAMALNLVDLNFGGRALGLWLSGKPWLCAVSGWFSIAFEAGFPFLIWFRKINPFVLAAGVLFHLGILLTLRVNTFSLVAVAAYPALLYPKKVAA